MWRRLVGGAAAAVYRGARASSARPHRLVALIYKSAENAVAWSDFSLERRPADYRFGASETTALFCDLRGFSGFTESSRRLWAMRRGKARSNPNQPGSLMKVQHVVKVEPVGGSS